MNAAGAIAEHLMAGLAVADLDPALRWYERFIGRVPDVVPNEKEAMWQVSGGGWLYIVLDPERAGRGLLTLLFADLDAQIVRLFQRGIETGSVETAPGLFRKVVLLDPDGNRIQLFEAA